MCYYKYQQHSVNKSNKAHLTTRVHCHLFVQHASQQSNTQITLMMSFPLTNLMLYWPMVFLLWRYPFSSFHLYTCYLLWYSILDIFSYCGCRINGLDYVTSMTWAEKPLKNVGLQEYPPYLHSQLLHVGHETKRFSIGKDIHFKQAWQCTRLVMSTASIRCQCN